MWEQSGRRSDLLTWGAREEGEEFNGDGGWDDESSFRHFASVSGISGSRAPQAGDECLSLGPENGAGRTDSGLSGSRMLIKAARGSALAV